MKAPAKIAAQKALELAWDGTLPVSPATIARKLKIKRTLEDGRQVIFSVRVVGKTSSELEGDSGQARLENQAGHSTFVCEYNVHEAAYRSRFTIAHELGHVLLNHVKEGLSPKRDTAFRERSRDPDEMAANIFAAELLMPEKMVKHLCTIKPPVAKLASAFGVSEAAMMYRLRTLGLAR